MAESRSRQAYKARERRRIAACRVGRLFVARREAQNRLDELIERMKGSSGDEAFEIAQRIVFAREDLDRAVALHVNALRCMQHEATVGRIAYEVRA